jgi:iron-sulfur cluster protein
LLNRIRAGLANKSQRAALYLGTEAGTEVAQKVYAQTPGGDDLPLKARKLKAIAIDNLDANLRRFTEAAKSSGINVHIATDAASAVRLIIDLARKADAKLIVKTKSMTGEEIDLRQHLEKEGFEVVETDLGERIVQLANQRPAHMTAPAIHMTLQQVTELFSESLGREIPPDPERIIAIARASLREKFLNADIGITGANFAIADSGAIVLVTNEGNARLVTALPRVTIAVVGVEKIVANMSDAFTLLQALIMSGAGRKLTSYVTIMRGGSRLAQNGLIQEQHVILLDNGRSKMRDDPIFQEALYCLRCGACNDICPTFRLFGGHVFGHIYTGPIGVPWTKYTATSDQAGSFAPLCISCGLCQSACPVRIDIPFLIAKVKDEYTGKHGQLPINRTLSNYETFVRLASAVAPITNFVLRRRFLRRALQWLLGIDSRRPFPHFTRYTFTKWFHSHVSMGTRTVAYFVDTYADMCEPEIGKAVVGILELNDCKVTLPRQVGSGMPSFLYGDMERTRRAAEFNVHHLSKVVRSGCEIISSEPTATYCLKELYPHLLQSSEAELVANHSHDLFEFLLNLHREGKLKLQLPGAFEEPVAYYAPCHTRSVYGKSNALEVLQLAGVQVSSVRYSTCCGIAGTFGFKEGLEGYDVSMAIGETLFQRLGAMNVRVVVTESSVCKMHIEHGTSLPVIHPAVLLWNMHQASYELPAIARGTG